MNTSVLLDYRGSLLSEKDRLRDVLAPYMDMDVVKSGMQKIEGIYETKLVNLKPRIMVYGIYNAGKSSIINELIREDRAEVADRPMTYKVDSYEWNGYILDDAPGVGAPQKHEEETEKYLPNADVVLFVMSSNGSNEMKQNYERMKNIVDKGKKIIIVLNDKDGILGKDDDLQIQQIKMKVVSNMKALGIQNVEDKFCIVAVNAMRAHKGRIGNKKNMYIKSNIEELEKVILAELRKTNSFSVMHNAIINIEEELEKIIDGVKSEDSDSTKVKKLLNELRGHKKNMREHMRSFIEKKTNRLGRELPGIIWPIVKSASGDNNNMDSAKDKISSIILDKIADISTCVQEEYSCQQREIADEIRFEVEGITNQLKRVNVDVASITYSGIEVIKPEDIDMGSGNLNDSLNTVGTVATVAGEFLESAAGKELVKQLGKTVLGKTVLAPVLGVIGPVLGPAGWIVTGVSLLKSILGGNDSEERAAMARAQQESELRRRQAEAEAQAEQDLHQKCEYMAEDFADAMRHEISHSIDEFFVNIERPFNEQLKSESEQCDKILAVSAELNEIYGNFVRIDNSIAAKI